MMKNVENSKVVLKDFKDEKELSSHEFFNTFSLRPRQIIQLSKRLSPSKSLNDLVQEEKVRLEDLEKERNKSKTQAEEEKHVDEVSSLRISESPSTLPQEMSSSNSDEIVIKYIVSDFYSHYSHLD